MEAVFEAELTRLNVVGVEAALDSRLPQPLDWDALFAGESEAEWLVENIWPLGRQVHMHAARKQGKSLVALWMAACIASGRDAFTGQPMPPKRVAYLDYEMTEDDLRERLQDMGFAPVDLINLRYFLHPALPKLDTFSGGTTLMDTLIAHDCHVVIIDTMSRVVEGDENSNDTYINFFAHSGQRMKAAGIAMLRLDHEGHEGGRSRGASAKADDVDLVWQLKATEEGHEFVRKATRISWVPESVKIRKVEEPTLTYKASARGWPLGTYEKVKEMDALEIPTDAGRDTVRKLLADSGVMPGKNAVIAAAIRFRKARILDM